MVLKKKRIKTIIKADVSDTKSQSSALIENIQRDDLNPVEESVAIVKFMKENKLTQQQAAQKLGKTRAYISNITRISKLPESVQDFVADGKLDRWHAYMLVGAPKDAQVELGTKAAEENWTLEKLKRNIVKADPKKQAEAKKKADAKKAAKPIPKHENLLLLVECKDAAEFEELEKALKDGDYTFWTKKKVLRKLDEILNPPKEDEKKVA